MSPVLERLGQRLQRGYPAWLFWLFVQAYIGMALAVAWVFWCPP